MIDHLPSSSIKTNYTPGAKGWASIYWQNIDSNCGDCPCCDGKGFKKLTFWAKGKKGGEQVEFKSGGIDNPAKPYKDSFEVTMRGEPLEKSWKQYTIDLSGQNLSNVIGGFAWVANRDSNPNGLTFYLDDIVFVNKGE